MSSQSSSGDPGPESSDGEVMNKLFFKSLNAGKSSTLYRSNF
jgi:hypothetical protein